MELQEEQDSFELAPVFNQLLVCIPMHNYSEGVLRIMDWLETSPAMSRVSWSAVIFNDASDLEDVSPVRLRVKKDKGDRYVLMGVPGPESGGPRYAVRRSGELAIAGRHEFVLVVETDAVPDNAAFTSMLKAFRSPIRGVPDVPGVVSASPVYVWPGTTRSCYPTNPNWFTTGHGNCYRRIDDRKLGKLALADAVPFLFSLWRPHGLLEIDDSMPKLMHLDTALGLKLTAQGHAHLRLLGNYVGHADGGAKSRKP